MRSKCQRHQTNGHDLDETNNLFWNDEIAASPGAVWTKPATGLKEMLVVKLFWTKIDRDNDNFWTDEQNKNNVNVKVIKIR